MQFSELEIDARFVCMGEMYIKVGEFNAVKLPPAETFHPGKEVEPVRVGGVARLPPAPL